MDFQLEVFTIKKAVRQRNGARRRNNSPALRLSRRNRRSNPDLHFPKSAVFFLTLFSENVMVPQKKKIHPDLPFSWEYQQGDKRGVAYEWHDPACEHLPIWPNHIGSFLIRDGEYSIHSNYYNYAFEYILEGNLKLFQRDQEFFAEAGDVCILHRGETNRFEPGSAGFARKLCVCMRGQLMTQLVASLGLTEYSVIHPANPRLIEETLLEIGRLLSRKNSEEIASIVGCGMKFLSALALSILKQKDYPFIQATNILQYNIPNQVSIRDVALKMNMSTSSLERLFRKNCGMTPKEYSIDLKMKTAATLLRNSSLNIKEISRQVGYPNPVKFSGEFKKFSGLSPLEFRRAKSKQEE